MIDLADLKGYFAKDFYIQLYIQVILFDSISVPFATFIASQLRSSLHDPQNSCNHERADAHIFP